MKLIEMPEIGDWIVYQDRLYTIHGTTVSTVYARMVGDKEVSFSVSVLRWDREFTCWYVKEAK